MVRITTTLLFVLIMTGTAASQEPKVHAILVVDTFSNVGPFVRIDKHNALRTIHGGFRDANQLHRLSYVVLEGADATPKNVIEHVRNLRPDPNDTIFFYYAGHGANESGRAHFLRMSAGKLYRATLRQEIERHNVRLKVILTESCSNVVPSMHVAMRPGANTGDWETLSQLFFSSAGTVDVNSCRPGQIARAGGGTGALWTHCFSGVLCTPRNEPVTWQSVLESVNNKLKNFVSPQMQSAYVYALGEGANGAAPQRQQPVSHDFARTSPTPQFDPQAQPFQPAGGISFPMHPSLPFNHPGTTLTPAATWLPAPERLAAAQGEPSEPLRSGGITHVRCIYPPRAELD